MLSDIKWWVSRLATSPIPCILVLLVIFLSTVSEDDVVKKDYGYCRAVQTFNSTGGEFGHPDFNGTYNKDC